MALPFGLTLPLHLRRRSRALVFATTRLSRHSARRVHNGTFQARIHDRKVVRAHLHNPMRPRGRYPRQLARPANVSCGNAKTREAKGKRAGGRDAARRLIKPFHEYRLRLYTTSRNSIIPNLTVSRP